MVLYEHLADIAHIKADFGSEQLCSKFQYSISIPSEVWLQQTYASALLIGSEMYTDHEYIYSYFVESENKSLGLGRI